MLAMAQEKGDPFSSLDSCSTRARCCWGWDSGRAESPEGGGGRVGRGRAGALVGVGWGVCDMAQTHADRSPTTSCTHVTHSQATPAILHTVHGLAAPPGVLRV